MARTPPCKECDKKGCGAYHSKCKRYLEYQEERKQISKKRMEEAEIFEYRRDCIK